MYAAWNPTPTVSDAAKLALIKQWERAVFPAPSGVQLYRLLEQLSYSTDWPDATDWTEVDSGGNVNLAGGEWSMNGNGAWNANGLYKTTGHARAVGYVQVDVKYPNAAVVDLCCGLNSAAALAYQYGPFLMDSTASSGRVYSYGGGALATGALSLYPQTHTTWYTARAHLIKGPGGTIRKYVFTMEGGTEFPTETVIGVHEVSTDFSDPFYPVLQRYTNNGAGLTVFRKYRWYTGFAADGPTLTYVMDCGANRRYTDIILTNIAAVGGWATTNVTFAWSCDDVDGKQNFAACGEHTLAQMQAHGALGETHRYFGLRITVNSDGATQQYAGEMNAGDLVSGISAGGLLTPNKRAGKQ